MSLLIYVLGTVVMYKDLFSGEFELPCVQHKFLDLSIINSTVMDKFVTVFHA
jgi:hypothetical protein